MVNNPAELCSTQQIFRADWRNATLMVTASPRQVGAGYDRSIHGCFPRSSACLVSQDAKLGPRTPISYLWRQLCGKGKLSGIAMGGTTGMLNTIAVAGCNW